MAVTLSIINLLALEKSGAFLLGYALDYDNIMMGYVIS